MYDFQVNINIPKNIQNWMTKNRTLDGLYVKEYDFHKLTIDYISIDYPCKNHIGLKEDYYNDDDEDEDEDENEDEDEDEDKDGCPC